MQAQDHTTLLLNGVEQRSGLLEGYSCCLLSRDPGFLDQNAKSAQVTQLPLAPCFSVLKALAPCNQVATAAEGLPCPAGM